VIVVLVHRKEAEEGLPVFGNPFDGIEVLGVFNTEEKANAEIEKHYGNGKNWHFQIEEVQGQFIRFEDGRE
jgi:hypothetical protein